MVVAGDATEEGRGHRAWFFLAACPPNLLVQDPEGKRAGRWNPSGVQQIREKPPESKKQRVPKRINPR